MSDIKVKYPVIFIICLAVILPSMTVTADSEGTGEAPAGAEAAVIAALECDPEISSLMTEEKNLYAALTDIRKDTSSVSNTDGVLQNIRKIWQQLNLRCHDVSYDVLYTLIAIDTETVKLAGLNDTLAQVGLWLGDAEIDFRTSRIDAAVLSDLRDKRDVVLDKIKISSLKITTLGNQYRRLTGHELPEDFDYASAWLLFNADKLDIQAIQLCAKDKPMSFFGDEWKTPVPFEGFVGDAQLKLLELRSALNRYAKIDKNTSDFEVQYKKGLVDKYALYGMNYERMIARLAVYDKKMEYSAAMLALDRASEGFVSSSLRTPPAKWFFAAERVYDGRLSVEFPWMAETPDGEWKLANDSDDERLLSFTVHTLPYGAEQAQTAGVYYKEKLLAHGAVADALTFERLSFAEDSLLKAVFFDNSGTEICSVFLDGFANAGRFFVYSPPVDEDEEVAADTDETDSGEVDTGESQSSPEPVR